MNDLCAWFRHTIIWWNKFVFYVLTKAPMRNQLRVPWMKAMAHNLIKKTLLLLLRFSLWKRKLQILSININNQPNPIKNKHYIIVNEIFELKKKEKKSYCYLLQQFSITTWFIINYVVILELLFEKANYCWADSRLGCLFSIFLLLSAINLNTLLLTLICDMYGSLSQFLGKHFFSLCLIF